jgi:hypothetical protein
MGMCISGATGTLYVSHDDPATGTMMSLYTRDLTTRAETLIGAYPANTFIHEIVLFRLVPEPTLAIGACRGSPRRTPPERRSEAWEDQTRRTGRHARPGADLGRGRCSSRPGPKPDPLAASRAPPGQADPPLPAKALESQQGAVLTRVAASHIRVATFQYAAALQDEATLRALADYAIGRHYPDLSGVPDTYLAFFRTVVDRQAALVARWQLVGFIHGVMNTDNMAVPGRPSTTARARS